jgi:aspartyl/asparaginyl-tRNA synthetase
VLLCSRLTTSASRSSSPRARSLPSRCVLLLTWSACSRLALVSPVNDASALSLIFSAVFRAENSNTHRHLTEFIGLDLEMAFESHYEEVMELIDGMFLYIFKNLQQNHRDEIETVKRSYPHDDLVFLDKTLVLKFGEGVKLLVESGWKEEDGSVPSELDDLSTAGERRLGQLIKEKYHTDYYILSESSHFPVMLLLTDIT